MYPLPTKVCDTPRRFLPQAECCRATRKHLVKSSRGQVVMPTGGGKTLCQIDAIRFYLNKFKKGKVGVVVILGPRIQLCIQHMKEHVHNQWYNGFNINTSNLSNRVKFHPMAVHSGFDDVGINFKLDRAKKVKATLSEQQLLVAEELKKLDGALGSSPVVCTTNPLEIQIEYDRVCSNNRSGHLLIFATYDSVHRIAEAGIPIDLVIADEAHNLVSNEFKTLHTIINAHRWLFYTATPKTTFSDQGHGMNNEELFGPVIFQVHPSTLIEQGIICKPLIHLMTCRGLVEGLTIGSSKKANNDEYNNQYPAIKELIKAQHNLTGFNPKIIVSCKNVPEAKHLEQSFREDSEFKEWDVFHISSGYGALVNGIKKSRLFVMEEINNTKKKSLIFHYDILSEGVDAVGISGAVFLRSMGETKTIQSIGRALRPKNDERHLPVKMRSKQYAIISIPMIESADLLTSEDYASYQERVRSICNAMTSHGLITPEQIMLHKPNGLTEEVDITNSPFVGGDPETYKKFYDILGYVDYNHYILDQNRKETEDHFKNLNIKLNVIKSEEELFQQFHLTPLNS
jgi:superfamily II DNA or RNA helicase